MLPGGLVSGGGGRGGGLCLLRWLGLRLWSRRGTLVFALLWFGSWLFLNGLVLVHRSILSDYCTDDKSKKILQRLCLEFGEGSVTGDMCEDLCVLGLVEYKRCLYYENGKKVIEARWRGNPVILKSKLENFSSYEPLGILDYQQDTAEELSALDVVFYATLEVRNSLGLAEEDEDEGGGGGGGSNSSLAKLWEKKLKIRDKSYSRAELSSLWSLLQQEEYTFLRVLQDLSSHVAKVLGSCGHFYAVEYLSAGHAWDQNIFSLDEVEVSRLRDQTRGRWSTREMVHRIALSFLDMVWHFDNEFTHKLHLCDIKPENFAIRKDLTVVAIDVDMAFFEPKMRDILEQNCSSDDDCNFFDCSSRCDPVKRRCSPHRRNSNLQVICEKIFRPWFSPTLLGAKAGLPLQIELQQAVQECSETDGGVDETEEDKGGGRDVYQRLVTILNRLIQDGGESGEGVVSWEGKEHVHTALNF
ncbi:divergent protein kinase domain 1C isoform X1 [Melanotaenia boesemani]|uniref:divergent protein kinase domain 1C isoform X1 n=1 Tax=Melanotaenia boesemani TaxID=1250792 RepID=UPI001C049E82|nr:divergent protein kinase domain 1C isoform X1 [Melanotaenia boesemani]XP_041824578.1 divergent protein kinase domain 1C isoform X1 [Melanotaenia boesemani]XP_041824579.1 divergent protein kinase domain 1C isoform X1 [Melanotaenia boesemani]